MALVDRPDKHGMDARDGGVDEGMVEVLREWVVEVRKQE
jgi:hypothetical protein